MLVGTRAGSVYCYDLDRVEEFWAENRLPRFASGTQLWRYETGSPIVGPPLVEGIAALFANRDGVLYGVEIEERGLLWQFQTDGRTSAPPAAAGGVAYVASEDRNLYAVAAENGLDKWEFVTADPILTRPSAIGGALYVVPGRAGVARVDRDTGRALWRADRVDGFLAEAGGRAYVSDSAGSVVALDRETGRPVGSALLNGYPVRLANALTDRVVVATPAGVVLCLKPSGGGFPVYHANPERRPVEPVFADPNAPAPGADSAPAPGADEAAAGADDGAN